MIFTLIVFVKRLTEAFVKIFCKTFLNFLSLFLGHPALNAYIFMKIHVTCCLPLTQDYKICPCNTQPGQLLYVGQSQRRIFLHSQDMFKVSLGAIATFSATHIAEDSCWDIAALCL